MFRATSINFSTLNEPQIQPDFPFPFRRENGIIITKHETTYNPHERNQNYGTGTVEKLYRRGLL